MNELTMLTRYGLMILTGYLMTQNILPEEFKTPVIEFGVIALPAVLGYLWKKWEDYRKN